MKPSLGDLVSLYLFSYTDFLSRVETASRGVLCAAVGWKASFIYLP